MSYKIKLGHNAAESMKNICQMKGENAVDHNKQMVKEILHGL